MENRKNQTYPEPWENYSYSNGCTRPPKNRGGLVAVLLVAVIFLGGIASALGFLNIRLTSEQAEADDTDGAVSFFPIDNEGDTPADSNLQNADPPKTGNAQLELNAVPDQVENIPQTGGLSLQQIYTKAIDSVVSITCKMSGGTGSGTGVVLSENGYIITNSHVIEGAASISVRFTDERTMTASVVGTDPVSDLAVLHVSATDLTPAEFGDSDSLRVGDAVAAIGDPLGAALRGTMTDGIVSAINREVSVSSRTMTLIQTNAALNSGNSGGPLLNCYGQVIGINTMKIGAFTDSAGVEGLGFAIPSKTVKEIVDQLVAQGYVSGRPSLGIQGEDVPKTYQMYYGLPAGVVVRQVTEGGAAQKAGLAAGDILLTLDGQRITGIEELNDALYACEAGQQVQIVVYRNRRQETFTLILGQAGA